MDIKLYNNQWKHMFFDLRSCIIELYNSVFDDLYLYFSF